VRFAWEGYHYWKNWEDFIGEKDPRGMAKLRECGAAMLRNSNSNAFLDKSARCMTDAGIKIEEWDFETATERLGKLGWDLSNSYDPLRIDDPQFGKPTGKSIQGALYCPSMGYVSDPQLATQNLCFAAEKNGTSFYFQKSVVEILQQGGKVHGLKLSDDSIIHTRIVVNASGPYSSRINKLAFTINGVSNDMKITTRPMRQEVAYTSPPPGVDLDKDGLITADFDAGVYWRPEVGNKLLIGGIEPECDTPDWFDGEIEDLNTNLTEDWTNYVYRAALRIPTLPIPSARKMQGIVSLYDVTPDWTPIYDKSSLGGYYMAIGTSGNQFKNAGIAGQFMGSLINACENGHDHDANPLQLETKMSNKGQFVNSRSFSRLRSVNDTSGSVLG
jgi:sarcosine oxidase subunit beta